MVQALKNGWSNGIRDWIKSEDSRSRKSSMSKEEKVEEEIIKSIKLEEEIWREAKKKKKRGKRKIKYI